MPAAGIFPPCALFILIELYQDGGNECKGLSCPGMHRGYWHGVFFLRGSLYEAGIGSCLLSELCQNKQNY